MTYFEISPTQKADSGMPYLELRLDCAPPFLSMGTAKLPNAYKWPCQVLLNRAENLMLLTKLKIFRTFLERGNGQGKENINA